MGTTITFNSATEEETLRLGFDTNGLQLDTTQDTTKHVLVGRDDDRQSYSLLGTKQFAKQFNNLGDGRSARYVPTDALPVSFQPTKQSNF